MDENQLKSQNDKQALQEQRKKASQIGLLLGALAFIIGSIIGLIYLLLEKPWKFR